MSDKFYNLITKRRTIRLFRQKKIPGQIIKKAINAGRLSPSAANLQILEYLVVTDSKLRQRVFPHTMWAGYLYPQRIPPEGRRPTLYIILLINRERFKRRDRREVGAAAENIILTLLSAGIGSCWIGAPNRRSLRRVLNIPAQYKIDSLIAAGYPAENPKLEADSKKVKYWLDKKNRLHVPKRPLKDVLHCDRIA